MYITGCNDLPLTPNNPTLGLPPLKIYFVEGVSTMKCEDALGETCREVILQVTSHHRVRANDTALSASGDINDSVHPLRED